jgi:predicted ArsR family transcriptional regulator
MSDNDAKMAASSSSPMSMPAQSPITEPTPHHHISLTNKNNTTTSPTHHSQSANKRSRGRPRKYHTDAEREEAKRRYRENHKTKAASSGGAVSGGAAGSNATLTAAAAAAAAASFQADGAKQSDVDELWEVVRLLQDEVRELREQLVERDVAAAAAQAGQKRKKV